MKYNVGRNFYIFPFYISLSVCLILSLFLWAKNFILNSHSMLYTVFSMLIATAFTVMPYSMLILCTHNKISGNDELYGIFWFLLALLSAKLSLAHIRYSGLSIMILWTTVAMLIYFFYQDKKSIHSIHSIRHLHQINHWLYSSLTLR